MLYRLLALLIACLALAASPAMAVGAKEATGAAFAASDGRGEIRLVWFPPLGKWPLAGWQVQEAGSGRVVAARVVIADPSLTEGLDAEDRQSAERLTSALKAARSPADMALLYGMTGAQAFGDWNYARAIGLAVAIQDSGHGARRYRVIGLDEQGRPARPVLVTPAVDPGVATPLPAPPTGFKAAAVEGGVALFWQPPRMARQGPILAYWIERATGGDYVPASEKPLVRAARWNPSEPAFVDRKAPLESELTYQLHSVDLFGHQSEAVSIKLYATDVAAMQPPMEFTAESGRGEVILHWQRSKNPHVAGYVVERSILPKGPFEAITPAGLRAADSRFVDNQVGAGTAYYYRLRMMGLRGDLGPPSRLVMAQVQGESRPSGVDGLKADVGRTRVRLTWEPLKAAVAGYLVERRDQAGGDWMRIQGLPHPQPFYDDQIGTPDGGSYSYRVIAVGYDSQESRPSASVRVDLPDLVSPPPPNIDRIDGRDGRVSLEFSPSAATDVSQVLVLRGEEPATDLVVGEPLPASAKRFVDESVEMGKTYWYSLVAVDKSGNRSVPASARVVRVTAPPIPAAPRPAVSYEAAPFPHARIRFDEPPEGLAVEIQYSAVAGQPWLVLAGPTRSAGEATHANLPAGTIRYRLVYRSDDGGQGTPSDVVTLDRH